MQYLSKSFLLLLFSVVICCVIYPLTLWVVGQFFFPFQANGSMLSGPDKKLIGSKLIAQPFTSSKYFQPRPSAASYNAAASSSSALAPSNYALRDRTARSLGQMATYKDGQSVAPDIEAWFKEDLFGDKPHIVAEWAELHSGLAQAWVTSDPANRAYVDTWAKMHHDLVAQFMKDNPSIKNPTAEDLAVTFFQNFSHTHPGQFPLAKDSSDIAPIFFDMWLQDHPHVELTQVPADMVTTSASGLDPDISLENARFQLGRVAAAWAAALHRDEQVVRQEIERVLEENAHAPLWGLAGEKHVNVLEVNLELSRRYG